MLLTVEYQAEIRELDIICDDEGIELLMDRLRKLKEGGGSHAHLMTPAWAGDELTEEGRTEGGSLINHVRIVMMRRPPSRDL